MTILDRVEVRVASDGYRMACRHVTPKGLPRGWIIMLHGIQSHSGWYEFTQQRLVRAGYNVRFPDRRGSGLNNVDRGHAPHWSRLINDVVHFLNDARAERDRVNSSAPVILGGLSWGGRLAYAVSRLRPELMDGLVLLYPGIVNRIGPRPLDRARLWLAGKLGITRRLVDVPLEDPALFTSSEKWQKFIERDGLAIHQVTSGFLIASECLGRICRQRPPDTHSSQNTLLILAGNDQIVDNSLTLRLLAAHCGDSLTHVEYPEAAHTLEFEACREEYIQTLIAWLDRRQAVTCAT